MEDTIRILVATDNHVGYNERDPIRGDDSWKTFHEIMSLAKERDVDMVLLGGDLFHDNVPTRKSMYNVMRSLRMNCYGDKPCEVELLSDGSKHFDGTIGHANYEDTNINVALPVFSIHGNHDDPSGDGHFAALDILEMSGLINYFGRVPRNDKIDIEPLCFQKGTTKLALYGLSNVRDERLHRTFRAKDVEFHQPSVQKKDWYNIAVVHQNHAAHTSTSYLPENFLASFLDLVVWGHEHECLIEPRTNAEMNFKVMQPGSSVATSLAPGEAVPKHVAILSITGREMKCEPIPLKTVRPFVYKEIVLGTEKEAIKLAKKDNPRHRLTQWLVAKVDELIEQARQQWEDAQEEGSDDEEERKFPLPLVRLRVEHSSIDGVQFEIENPQRFSQRFTGRVANNHDILQLHVKKRNAAARRLVASEELKQMMAKTEASEGVKVAELVAKFFSTQSLTILPQNYFEDAVSQYIDKDDKHAMDMFISESLGKQIRNLVKLGEDGGDDDDEDLAQEFDKYKTEMEEMFKNGQLKIRGSKERYKPKPSNWNDDSNGVWEDQPAALLPVERDNDDDDASNDSDVTPKPVATTRGRGRGRGARGGVASTRGRGTAAAAKKTTATTNGRSKRKKVEESDEESEAEDVIMVDDDDDEGSDSQAMFFSDARGKKTPTATAGGGSRAASVTSNVSKAATARKPAAATATRKTPARAAAPKGTKQSTLSFSTSQASVLGNARSQICDIEDDEDDEDAFEPASTTRSGKGRR